MTLEEIRKNVQGRSGWKNLQIAHDVQKRQVRWWDDSNYGRSLCVIGIDGEYTKEVYGRPMCLLTEEEWRFVKILLHDRK